MQHFIYITVSKSGKYYIGRHSTKDVNDGYFGSGKWIRSIKDKSTLKREILEICTEDNLREREEHYLKENVGRENCMNFNLNSVGFSSGYLNPAHNELEKIKRSNRASGENNPAKRLEVRKKMSDAQKNRPTRTKGIKMSNEGRKNISEGRKGLKISEEGRKKLSEARLRDYANGTRKPHTKSGWTHSEESKKIQSENAKNRPKFKCLYCDMITTKANLTRFHDEKCKHKLGV
jgi:hypothetical protein